MKAAKRGKSDITWDSLPRDLIGCLIDKLEGDFTSISAVRNTCKHWRESSLLLTSFKTSSDQREKHENIEAMASFISKAEFLRKLVIAGPSGDTIRLFDKCDWTKLSHSLCTLDIDFNGGSTKAVGDLVSRCQSLSELRLSSLPYRAPGSNLSFQLVERLRKLELSGWIDPEWMASLPHLPNMEELDLSCNQRMYNKIEDIDLVSRFPVTLSTPKLRTLKVVFARGILKVKAPLVQTMDISAVVNLHLHVYGAVKLESLTLGPATILVDGPQYLKKLVIKGTYLSQAQLLGSLHCLQAVPSSITSLTIMAKPMFSSLRGMDESPSIADMFVGEVNRLTKLEALELNVHVIDLLKGAGPLVKFLPKLSTMTVNFHPPVLSSAEFKKAFGERIVETLEEFKFTNLKTKNIENADYVAKTKMEQYFRKNNTSAKSGVATQQLPSALKLKLLEM